MAGFLALTDLKRLGELSLLQRMLLVCDGTLTDVVEAAFLEPIVLVKLAVETEPSPEPMEELQLAAGAPVMRREILLRGARSGTNYVYAESIIAVDALPVPLREALLNTDAPLGRLWVEHRLETRKEILSLRRLAAGEGPARFGEAAARGQLARQYRVFSGGLPIMLISEFFPVSATE